MISHEEIMMHLKLLPEVSHVVVDGDGHHYQLTVVSDVFVNQSKLSRQKWLYGKINHWIASGALHAVHMNTWTNEEWEKQRG